MYLNNLQLRQIRNSAAKPPGTVRQTDCSFPLHFVQVRPFGTRRRMASEYMNDRTKKAKVHAAAMPKWANPRTIDIPNATIMPMKARFSLRSLRRAYSELRLSRFISAKSRIRIGKNGERIGHGVLH